MTKKISNNEIVSASITQDNEKLAILNKQLDDLANEKKKIVDAKLKVAEDIKQKINTLSSENNVFIGIILSKEDIAEIVKLALNTNEQVTIECAVYIK